MQFNPLFFNTNQTSPEFSRPNKLSNVSYLFSDIIKVLLGENAEQNREESINTDLTQDKAESVLDAFDNIGNIASEKMPAEEIPGNKLKISLDEIGNSSIEKLFAGMANAILQTCPQISILKSQARNIEISSSIPENEVRNILPLFVKQINENFRLKGINESSLNQESLKLSNTVQFLSVLELDQISPEKEESISSIINEGRSIKFKLESPEEIFTLEIRKVENKELSGTKINSGSILNKFQGSQMNESELKINFTKVFADESVKNLETLKKEDTIIADKTYSKKSDDLKLFYPENGKENGIKSIQVNTADKFSKDDIEFENLKSKLNLKLEIEPKENFSDSKIKIQPGDIKTSNAQIKAQGKDSVDAQTSGAVSKEKPILFSHGISHGKESLSEYEKSNVPVKNFRENITIKNDLNEKNDLPSSIPEKELTDDQKKYSSEQFKPEDASNPVKTKIQDSISLDSGKNFSSHLSNGQTEVKEAVQKGNLPFPSFKSEETRIISYSNLTEEISGIIKENEVKSVVLKLHPEELGKVKVVLDMVNNGIRAGIEVSNESVKQAVQSNIDQLKQNLINHGIQLTSLDITLNNYEQKPNKTFDQKKPRYSETRSEEEVKTVDNGETAAKKLGYNTYEYLI